MHARRDASQSRETAPFLDEYVVLSILTTTFATPDLLSDAEPSRVGWRRRTMTGLPTMFTEGGFSSTWYGPKFR